MCNPRASDKASVDNKAIVTVGETNAMKEKPGSHSRTTGKIFSHDQYIEANTAVILSLKLNLAASPMWYQF